MYLANFLAELGISREAELALVDGIAFDESHGRIPDQADKQLALAYLLAQTDSGSKASDLALRAAQMDGSIDHLLRAGTILARAGLRTSANRLLAQLRTQPAIPRVQLAIYRLQSEIQLAAGAAAPARKSIETATALLSPTDEIQWLTYAFTILHDAPGVQYTLEQTIESPGRLWMYSAMQYPGIWRKATFQYLGLSSADTKEMCTAMTQHLSHKTVDNAPTFTNYSNIQNKFSLFCSHIN